MYAPLKFGHVLSVSAAKGAPKTNLIPYSFIQKQILTSVDNEGKFDKYSGLNGVNNGIQMTLLKELLMLVKISQWCIIQI